MSVIVPLPRPLRVSRELCSRKYFVWKLIVFPGLVPSFQYVEVVRLIFFLFVI